MGTAADNILDWLKNFDRIAAHDVWNDQKQLQVIPVYLKDTALNFYCSLPDQTKTDINLLKTALRDCYHTQDHLYDMRVKLHELRQGSSLETYINDLDTLARHLTLNNRRLIISSLGSSLNWNKHFLYNNPRHTTMLLLLQSGGTTSQIPILILS